MQTSNFLKKNQSSSLTLLSRPYQLPSRYNKKRFIKVALDKNFETFIIYVTILKALLLGIIINFLQEA